MPLVLALAIVSVTLQLVIFALLKQKNNELCEKYFDNVLFKNDAEHMKKTMAFYYNPINWKLVQWPLKLMLALNFGIFIFILYKFFIAS
ncbi:hypothetical protein [Endozoicomonas acroporae]|uniref:hypothetical protein n=1 Tax=Endozoicomonas acroporae TaxID=1701104 RepID=UPI003D78E309